MTLRKMAFEIEDLQNQAAIIHSMQNTLYAAIFKQKEFSYTNYEWAFVALGEMTVEQEDRMKELRDAVFDYMRKEAGDVKRETDPGQALRVRGAV